MEPSDEIKKGDIVEGVVRKITPFGAFVTLKNGKRGLIHISQIDDNYVKKVDDYLKIGDSVRAKVVAITKDGKIDLSIKKARPRRREEPKKAKKPGVFKITPLADELTKIEKTITE